MNGMGAETEAGFDPSADEGACTGPGGTRESRFGIDPVWRRRVSSHQGCVVCGGAVEGVLRVEREHGPQQRLAQDALQLLCLRGFST